MSSSRPDALRARLVAVVALIALVLGAWLPTGSPGGALAQTGLDNSVGRLARTAPLSFVPDVETIAEGFSRPQAIAFPPDGSGRMFVAERGGTIRIARGEVVQTAPYLDITDLVEAETSEQGVLGLAFHPRYAENGHFYVHYTPRDRGVTGGMEFGSIIVRYRVSSDPDAADPQSATLILAKGQPNGLHFGGHLAFGPDGMLWIGSGDGGGHAGQQLPEPERARDISVLQGKILRIDVDGGEPYAIPADNPFVGVEGAAPEVWAYGLRNPWRFSFDRLTGDLYVADVGQARYEEINFVPVGSTGGLNFGWNWVEGIECYPDPGLSCDFTGLTLPVAGYQHGRNFCAVVGGHVYRGSRSPEMYGYYLYADFCSGRILALTRLPDGEWIQDASNVLRTQVSALGEDENGELYVAGYRDGVVYRLVARPENPELE